MRQLADLKTPDATGNDNGQTLVAVQGAEALLGTLAATWPVGPRLDELIHRARPYLRWKGDAIEALSYVPSKWYSSLPYSSSEQNPNLVRVFIDAQHDYLHDRIYMLGALLVGCEQGEPHPDRRRVVVRMTQEAPTTGELEEALFVRWIGDLLRAILEVVAPDEQGEHQAPIHLILSNCCQRAAAADAGQSPYLVFGCGAKLIVVVLGPVFHVDGEIIPGVRL